jgi:hypothetical protein
MRKLFLWCGLFLFPVLSFGQKNEVDVVLGNTWSLNSNTTIAIPGLSPVTVGSGRVSNLTYEVGLARQLASFGPGALSLELNAAGFPKSLDNFASVFVVPAAKFTFMPRSRVSPFASAGVGFVHLAASPLPSVYAAAFQFGGGADVKTPIRFLNLRVEARDFLATQSGFASLTQGNPGTTFSGSSRNHVLFGGGAVLRF